MFNIDLYDRNDRMIATFSSKSFEAIKKVNNNIFKIIFGNKKMSKDKFDVLINKKRYILKDFVVRKEDIEFIDFVPGSCITQFKQMRCIFKEDCIYIRLETKTND